MEIRQSPNTRKKEKEEYNRNSQYAHTHRNKHRKPRKHRSDIFSRISRDVLHPNRPNVSKDELREKLADLYKSNKDQVSVFGFRTQYGGGKSTGFALVYDSSEALKKFEPHYRLVRIGAASKIEKASRQQRMFFLFVFAIINRKKDMIL